MATGSQAFTADWFPGTATSEGSSHGDPPEVVVLMIDSPRGTSLPRTDQTRSLRGSNPQPNQKVNQQKDLHRATSPKSHSRTLLRKVRLCSWKLLQQERFLYAWMRSCSGLPRLGAPGRTTRFQATSKVLDKSLEVPVVTRPAPSGTQICQT